MPRRYRKYLTKHRRIPLIFISTYSEAIDFLQDNGYIYATIDDVCRLSTAPSGLFVDSFPTGPLYRRVRNSYSVFFLLLYNTLGLPLLLYFLMYHSFYSF